MNGNPTKEQPLGQVVPMPPRRLWAITSYFNPMGWRSRRENYRVFRERLNVPLITVELGCDGRFDLEDGDATVMVRAERGDILWQKERLLNLALRRLPGECDAVAWIDGDVVFGREDWSAAALEELRASPMLHLFDRVLHLAQGRAPGETTDAVEQCSIVSAARQEPGIAACFEARAGRKRRYWSSGLAWAARRALLDEHGFYDRCIIGGGDTAMVCAAVGAPEVVMDFHRMGPAQRAGYGRWAEALHALVRGRIGVLAGTIEHLWHGGLGPRHYLSRHQRLASYGFDPALDVAEAEGGGLVWATNKPELHEYIRAYLASRNEDGAVLPASDITGRSR